MKLAVNRVDKDGSTVFDFLEPRDRCSKLELWRAAFLASRLAKVAYRRQQRHMYAIKDRCLLRLFQMGALEQRADADRFPGLTSVNLRGRNERLHTHEGWLLRARSNEAAA